MSELNFIHITDCHLLDLPEKKTREINTYDSLSSIIKNIKDQNLNYDFLLITGDISQDASKESYQLFLKLISTLNKPTYCLPGNHDSPTLLKEIIQTSPNQAISVNLVKNHLLILLNSHVPEFESGKISDNQLQQLNNILERNINRPVIVALHHPPIKIQVPWMDAIGLSNGVELLNLLEKFLQVKLLFFGHVHQEIEYQHQNIKIIGTPSTCYQFETPQPGGSTEELKAGYRKIILHESGTIETQVYRINL